MVQVDSHILGAASGGLTAFAAPVDDFISKALLGIVVGVGVWCITKLISYLVAKVLSKA